jgi:acyl-coenzyme A thioesterase PaaI-like protein
MEARAAKTARASFFLLSLELTSDFASRYYGESGGIVRTIHNPFVGMPGYSCFGCSPKNASGLRMQFSEDGDEIVCFWNPEAHFSGYASILHGGIQATLHDEIASWVVFVKVHTSGFTERLEMDYRNPVRVDSGSLSLRSRLEKMEGNKAFIRTSLFDGKGKLGSESLAVYFTLPQRIALWKHAYPEDDAAFFGE